MGLLLVSVTLLGSVTLLAALVLGVCSTWRAIVFVTIADKRCLMWRALDLRIFPSHGGVCGCEVRRIHPNPAYIIAS